MKMHGARVDAVVQAYAQAVIRHPLRVIGASLLLVAALGIGASHLTFTNDYRAFFGPENPQLRAFEELQNIYTKNDNVLFVVSPRDGDVFSTAALSAVSDLTAAAWRLPYSIRVDSLTNFQHTRADGDELVVSDLVEELPLSASEADAVRAVALTEPLLANRLVTSDARHTGVNVTFQLPGTDIVEVPTAAAAANALAARIARDHPAVEIHVAGIVMMNNAFSEASMHDGAALMPLMFIVILSGLAILLRSLAGMLVTLAVIMLSVISAMGAAGWLSIGLTPPSASAPIIIMTLAVADAVHLLVTMFEGMRAGKPRQIALLESLRVNFGALFLTSVTTAVGFLTMNSSDAPPFRDLGNITALGVSAAWLLSVTTLPALIAIIPMRAPSHDPRLGKLLRRFSEWVLRRRHPALAGSAGIAAVLVVLASTNVLNDDFVRYFGERTQIRKDLEYANATLGGIYALQFSLPAQDPGGVADPSYLTDVEGFAAWLRTQPGVLHVASIASVLARLNRNMHGDDPAFHRLPEDRELAAQYLLLYEMSLPFGLDLNNQINIDKSASQVVVTVNAMDARALRTFSANAETWLREKLGMTAIAVGPPLMFAHISERNVQSMLSGTLLGIIAITFIMMISLRSLKLGIVSMIVNLLPALAAFGVWALIDGELNMAVAIMLGMSLGIVVDYSVHFLSKFLHARRSQDCSAEDAIRHAFSSVGVALVVTTAILTAGFAVLAQSDFQLNVVMATLTGITIVLALAAEFVLLPPLLLRLEGATQKDTAETVVVTETT